MSGVASGGSSPLRPRGTTRRGSGVGSPGKNDLGPKLMTAMGEGRPRLVVLNDLAMTTPLDPYLSLRALAAYSGLSPRRLRDLLRDPDHPVPHYRIGGKILVRRSEFDGWLARYRQVGSPDVDRIVADALQGLR